MELQALGHSCFKLRGKKVTVITDPYNPEYLGLKLSRQQADVVTISHGHGDHNYLDVVKPRTDGSLFVVEGPGEYEIQDIIITGWQTFHDDKEGQERGKNTIYKIELDGVRVVHLGDLGHQLSDNLIDEIGDVDVLLVPVGGYYTIDYRVAASLIKQIDPRIVVPMHYFYDGMDKEKFGELTTAEPFIKELGMETSEVQPKITVSEGSLPMEMQVVVLRP